MGGSGDRSSKMKCLYNNNNNNVLLKNLCTFIEISRDTFSRMRFLLYQCSLALKEKHGIESRKEIPFMQISHFLRKNKSNE